MNGPADDGAASRRYTRGLFCYFIGSRESNARILAEGCPEGEERRGAGPLAKKWACIFSPRHCELYPPRCIKYIKDTREQSVALPPGNVWILNDRLRNPKTPRVGPPIIGQLCLHAVVRPVSRRGQINLGGIACVKADSGTTATGVRNSPSGAFRGTAGGAAISLPQRDPRSSSWLYRRNITRDYWRGYVPTTSTF